MCKRVKEKKKIDKRRERPKLKMSNKKRIFKTFSIKVHNCTSNFSYTYICIYGSVCVYIYIYIYIYILQSGSLQTQTHTLTYIYLFAKYKQGRGTLVNLFITYNCEWLAVLYFLYICHTKLIKVQTKVFATKKKKKKKKTIKRKSEI